MAGRGGLPEARRIWSKDAKTGRMQINHTLYHRLKLGGRIGWLIGWLLGWLRLSHMAVPKLPVPSSLMLILFSQRKRLTGVGSRSRGMDTFHWGVILGVWWVEKIDVPIFTP